MLAEGNGQLTSGHLMWPAGDDALANAEVRHRSTHCADHRAIAVAHESGVVWRAWEVLGPLKVTSVRTNFKCGHDRVCPHVVRAQILRVKGSVLDTDVAGTFQPRVRQLRGHANGHCGLGGRGGKAPRAARGPPAAAAARRARRRTQALRRRF